MRKISQAELTPAAQARARASSSTRRLRRNVRISVSGVVAVACFEPTSQRITAKDSRVSPILPQPPLACRSASSSLTTDCTAEIGLAELMSGQTSLVDKIQSHHVTAPIANPLPAPPCTRRTDRFHAETSRN